MKFGPRIPNLTKKFAARTSIKRYLRHSSGLKMPRGTGFVTNPKRALYNKVYNKTSFNIGIPHLPVNETKSDNTSSTSLLKLVLIFFFFPVVIAFFIVKAVFKQLMKEKPDQIPEVKEVPTRISQMPENPPVINQ